MNLCMVILQPVPYIAVIRVNQTLTTCLKNHRKRVKLIAASPHWRLQCQDSLGTINHRKY